MKIKRFNKIGFCNVCKCKFDSGFEFDLDKRFFNNIKICNKCAGQFYKDLSSFFVPKSIVNINKTIKKVDENFK